MGQLEVTIGELLIGKVSDCLGGGSKDIRSLFPTHRQGKQETDQGFIAWSGREQNTELWNIRCVNPYSVETIDNVYFGHVDRSHMRVGMLAILEDAP
jgi:hypothetical protein